MCPRSSRGMTKLKVQASTLSKARGALCGTRLQRIGKQQASDEKVMSNVLCSMVAGLPRCLVTK